MDPCPEYCLDIRERASLQAVVLCVGDSVSYRCQITSCVPGRDTQTAFDHKPLLFQWFFSWIVFQSSNPTQYKLFNDFFGLCLLSSLKDPDSQTLGYCRISNKQMWLQIKMNMADDSLTLIICLSCMMIRLHFHARQSGCWVVNIVLFFIFFYFNDSKSGWPGWNLDPSKFKRLKLSFFFFTQPTPQEKTLSLA